MVWVFLSTMQRKAINFPAGLSCRYHTLRQNWREIQVPKIISPFHVNILPSAHYQLLYHSVPKAACTLLRAFMLELEGVDTRNLDLHSVTRLAQERFLRPFVGRGLRYRHYKRFCFVRNPWSRLVSCYKSLQSKRKRGESLFLAHEYQHINFDTMSFPEFVRFVCATSERKSNHHFRSQHYFLRGGKIDFIGRFEHLERDLHTVVNRYNLPIAFKGFVNKYLNRGDDRTRYQEYYDSLTYQLVSKRYAKDIRLFNYTFNN